jgi:hypothetical protein
MTSCLGTAFVAAFSISFLDLIAPAALRVDLFSGFAPVARKCMWLSMVDLAAGVLA